MNQSSLGIHDDRLNSLRIVAKFEVLYPDEDNQNKFMRFSEILNGTLLMIKVNMHIQKHKDKYGSKDERLPKEVRDRLDTTLEELKNILSVM
ncbi:hypothetical protein Tco_0877907 [Tanacetum coccineum]|uniref:Uncharacterized protein n=1 Tax=Tanacetum coccineum TaxID=301880 RepID=A0ABQ5BZ54_9ASTR